MRRGASTRRYSLRAFALGVMLVFSVLTGFHEGRSLTLAVILLLPMCVPCAVAGVFFRGMDNNLFTQIGFGPAHE